MLTFVWRVTTMIVASTTAYLTSSHYQHNKLELEAASYITSRFMIIKETRERQSNLITIAKALAVVWVILSLAEASVTYLCLKDAANIEGNPLGRILLNHNEVLFYGAKLLVTIAVGYGFWWLATKTAHLKMMIACQILLVFMFTSVFINNLLHL